MKKRLTAMALALVMVLSLVPAAFAADVAKASTQSVEVDGTKIEFQMYALVDANGGETNYVKLRDVAHVLNSTPAKFSVGYDGTISITTGESYTDNGSEMTTPYSGDRAYKPGPGAVKVNGADVNLDAIVLTDDNGGAYTYFKLRDLGTALGFKVDWTGERGVFIETGAGTAPEPQTVKPLTLDDLQGTWYCTYGGENDAAFEFTFDGNRVTHYRASYATNNGYIRETFAVTPISQEAYPNSLDLEKSDFQCVRISSTGQEENIGTYAGALTQEHIGRISEDSIYINGNTYERLPESKMGREIMEIKEKQEELRSKYPSYADYPGVPDAGIVLDRRLTESSRGTASYSKDTTHYYYTIVEKEESGYYHGPDFEEAFGAWMPNYIESELAYEKLYDKYADILIECGYFESHIKTYFGDQWGFKGNGWVVIVYQSYNAMVVVVQPDD